MKDRFDAAHAVVYEGAIGDRADVRGVGRRFEIDADRLVPGRPERSHERLAEMAGASRDQNPHR
jgi:hypothetical protein